MGYKPYTFTVPTLPRKIYDKLQELCKYYDTNQWRVICMALDTLWEAKIQAPQYVQDRSEEAKKLKLPWTPKGWETPNLKSLGASLDGS